VKGAPPPEGPAGVDPGLQARLDAALAEMRAEYLEELPAQLAQLAGAMDRAADGAPDGALREAITLAHRLRGTGGSLGFEALSEAGGRIEDALCVVAQGGAGSDEAREAARRALAELLARPAGEI
jgi:HPt (histidine-containing phosphotransfer) domain-containing protein